MISGSIACRPSAARVNRLAAPTLSGTAGKIVSALSVVTTTALVFPCTRVCKHERGGGDADPARYSGLSGVPAPGAPGGGGRRQPDRDDLRGPRGPADRGG